MSKKRRNRPLGTGAVVRPVKALYAELEVLVAGLTQQELQDSAAEMLGKVKEVRIMLVGIPDWRQGNWQEVLNALKEVPDPWSLWESLRINGPPALKNRALAATGYRVNAVEMAAALVRQQASQAQPAANPTERR